MPSASELRRVDWPWTPLEAFARWPRDRPLAMLCSCPTTPPIPGTATSQAPPATGNRARWSYIAQPMRAVTIGLDHPDPLGRLQAEVSRCVSDNGLRVSGLGYPDDPRRDSPVPFTSGWLVALSYELGSRLEPAVGNANPSPDWPWAIVLWRCPTIFAYDHAAACWWSSGNAAEAFDFPDLADESPPTGAAFGPIAHGARAAYEHAVARVVEYTHAGDIFQANLSHHLKGTFEGSTRSLFRGLAESASPWYGAYLECPSGNILHAAASLSPELFLEADAASRTVTTRPIKGTRRADVDPRVLKESPKDQAELNMIVDLMRNDLGRICEPGSVRVGSARDIERHGGERSGVHHGVATVQGTLRPAATVADLLRATFPAGSITGAPKIRAMQIIRELEPAPRGLYTGAIGYIGDCGNVSLSVAIRTAVVHGRRNGGSDSLDEIAGGTLSYGAGAGIVADSVPAQEWQETLDKARIITHAPSPSPPTTVRPRIVQGAPA